MGAELSQVADHIANVVEVVGDDVVVSDVTHDSRQVRPGALFVAIRGESFDGHDFVSDAVQRGASAVMVDTRQDLDLPQIVVSDTRVAMAHAARAVFSFPDESLAIVGITGTNGKTTVSHMLESILRAADIPVGIIGTLGARIGDRPIEMVRTTPEATDLHRLLATMRDAGCDVVIMEVSSHAIALHRTEAVRFSIVGFTNLSQDHLDFHGDMESYFAVKKSLFDPHVASLGVINVDDPWGERLAAESRIDSVLVSVDRDADIQTEQVTGAPHGTHFRLITSGISTDVSLPLVGDFNVSNALVASAVAVELGVDPDTIATGLAEIDPISGRMEVIQHSGPFNVIVDYAHTPDAIEVVLRALRSITSGRVISLIGAGGDRDQEKRSMMGAAAARFSDLTIVTTDNPRTEDPASIASEVARGAKAQPHAVVRTILDRRTAIRSAVSEAEAGDAVIILGKGHEQGQDTGSIVLPFDDAHESREALRIEAWDPL